MKTMCMVFLLLIGNLAMAQAPKILATFALHEDFGVSHPDQIVYFGPQRKVDPGEASLLDEQGKPVPFQVMNDGRIAVRTDLSAGTTKNWKLIAATATQMPGITVVAGADGYEIVNDQVGIRVPKAPADLTKTPAPIQGLRFQDGTWTAVGPNFMPRAAKGMTVELLEQGPLVVKVKVSYVYDKGPLHSHLKRPEFPDVPAGEGPYCTTIEIQAGQPSILFEEECEVDISYQVDITSGLTPDRGQYRGHHANSTDEGMDPDGSVYRYGNNVRHDALVRLKYEGKGKDRWSGTTYPFMSHWDPWGVNTGFYWQLYDSRPNGSDNLFGIFAGPASRLINPGLTGVSLDTKMLNGVPHAGLQVRFRRLMPTQYYTTHMRFAWGIHLGKKGTDVKPQMEVQGINKQMNLHGGVNLNTLAKLPIEYPDPREGYGTLYAPVTAWKGVADALREEKLKGGHTFYRQQYSRNSHLGDLLQYWASPTSESARKAADPVNDYAKSYLENLVNGEGIYQHSTHYFMGASSMSSFIIWIDQLLASEQLSASEKAKLKRSAALFAATLWDNDVVPMQENCGMNWGPANMASMWRGTRYTYTLFLSTHPNFSKEVHAVQKEAFGLLYEYTNAAGACSACSPLRRRVDGAHPQPDAADADARRGRRLRDGETAARLRRMGNATPDAAGGALRGPSQDHLGGRQLHRAECAHRAAWHRIGQKRPAALRPADGRLEGDGQPAGRLLRRLAVENRPGAAYDVVEAGQRAVRRLDERAAPWLGNERRDHPSTLSTATISPTTAITTRAR